MDATTPKNVQAPQRAPASPIALLALLMAMTALGPLTLNILVPAVPNLVATMNTDPATVQLTISLYLFGIAVSQLVLGPLSDRFGRRPVVIAGLAVTAAASVLAIAMSSIGGLIAARTLQAFGASSGLVIGRAIVRDLYDRERAASMIGWVTTVMVVAPMVAPLIGGLLDTAFGWEAIFVFVAVSSCAVLAWAVLALPETRPDHITGGGMRFIAGESRELLRDRNFLGYMLAGGIATATFFAFLGGGPHLVIGIMGRSSAEYGAWFALTAFGYMIGNLIAARLSPRFGIENMIRAGIALQILGAVVSIALAHGLSTRWARNGVSAAIPVVLRQRHFPPQRHRRRDQCAPAGRRHRLGHHRLHADGARRDLGAGDEHGDRAFRHRATDGMDHAHPREHRDDAVRAAGAGTEVHALGTAPKNKKRGAAKPGNAQRNPRFADHQTVIVPRYQHAYVVSVA